MQGIDIELIPRVTDLAGKDDGPGTPGLFIVNSLLRSVSRNPIVNSENHFLGDGSTTDVPRGEVRSGFWLQALSGLDASVAWVWGHENRNPLIGQWAFRPGPMT